MNNQLRTNKHEMAVVINALLKIICPFAAKYQACNLNQKHLQMLKATSDFGEVFMDFLVGLELLNMLGKYCGGVMKHLVYRDFVDKIIFY